MVTTAAFANRTPTASALPPLNELSQRSVFSEPGYEWKSQVKNKLAELLRLEPGWDGYQAPPVSLENAYFALRLLEAVCSPTTPAPQIVPGFNGDLQLEWHTRQADIELHILAPYRVQAWMEFAGTASPAIETTLTNDFITVGQLLRKISERSSDITATVG